MKYPFDIYTALKSVKGRKETFSIEAHFVRETEESPMKVFQEPFSRYKFVLIENGTAISANLPVDKIEGMIQKTKSLFLIRPAAVSQDTPGTPAYTLRFFSGTLKGKTPVEVLAENYDTGKDLLKKQYTWLKENLEKYPKNKEFMDAIQESAKISREDIAKVSGTPQASAPMTIVSEPVRPLVRNKREDGKCLCYSLSVTYEQGKDYPVTVTIENYYAPVNVKETGQMNALTGQMDKESFKKFSYTLSLDEWAQAASIMELSRNSFYISNFGKAMNLAEAEDRKNRENYKNAPAQAPAPMPAADDGFVSAAS